MEGEESTATPTLISLCKNVLSHKLTFSVNSFGTALTLFSVFVFVFWVETVVFIHHHDKSDRIIGTVMENVVEAHLSAEFGKTIISRLVHC